MAELVFLAPKEDISRYANADHSRANVVVRTGAVGTKQLREVEAALRAAIQQARLPAGIEADVTGNAILAAHSADGLANAQPLSVAIATITCLVIATIGIGSLRVGPVAMIAERDPGAVLLRPARRRVAPLSLPTSLIGCVALGITVDDTVHYLVRYKEERARGNDPGRRTCSAPAGSGAPYLVTSVPLIAGFLVIALSGFATLRQFGLLSAATMAMCLVCDLELLPAMLQRFKVSGGGELAGEQARVERRAARVQVPAVLALLAREQRGVAARVGEVEEERAELGARRERAHRERRRDQHEQRAVARGQVALAAQLRLALVVAVHQRVTLALGARTSRR